MQTTNRLLTLLLVLILLLQSTVFSIFAIEPVDYSYTEDYSTSTYASSYNTGKRHEVCDELSSQAKSYYTGKYTWDSMSALTGGTTNCLKTDNDLFEALSTLMSSTMTNSVSYKSLTEYWPSTDGTGTKSQTMLFYSDTTGSSFNREHVWPKSHASFKESNGGSDLHHLRPTDSTINSTRGNLILGNVRQLSSYNTKSYGGKTVLYYTSSTCEVNDNIKGDVARILLYVWCRWEEPNLFMNDPNPTIGPSDDKNDGGKVIESLTTLLEWCKLDPVDEWEMCRNDLVQDIQGNRNIFIDYPEYAWLVFGLDVPSDMTTPSGKASGGVNGSGSGSGSGSGDGVGGDIGGGSTDTPDISSPIIVGSPKVNVPYKFGMLQSNAGNTYYITGGMSTYYMSTTTDYDSALDIYLEKADGGYYIYTYISGAKKYINSIVQAGSDGRDHVNGIFAAEAETIYTFNTEINTLVTVIDGKDYVFGTRNDNSYTTVGPIDLSNDPFFCQLYTTNTDSIGPDQPDQPDQPTINPNIKQFESLVKSLDSYLGSELYKKIREAVSIYSRFTADEKKEVADSYADLVAAAERYNAQIDELHKTSATIKAATSTYLDQSISVNALSFAVYQMFCKKHETI